MYDIIVIGAGPAGLTAALYALRASKSVLVIEQSTFGGQVTFSPKIENYPGIPEMSGNEFADKLLDQVLSMGAEVEMEKVTGIVDEGNRKLVFADSKKYEAQAVIIAVGVHHRQLGLSNENQLVGNGVSYCAVCDGFIYRKKRIALIGSGDYMKAELDVLKRFTKDLFVFTNGLDTDITDIEVIKDEIVEFSGDGVLKSIITNNNSYEVDAAFIAVGSQDTLSLAKHLGLIVDEKGDLIVTNSHTNISGIFAGGDCTQGVKQIVKAAADGCIAAYEIKEYLRGK